jgi:hypothetical protein
MYRDPVPDLEGLFTDCLEEVSVLKNPFDARFRPRSGTKTPVFGAF